MMATRFGILLAQGTMLMCLLVPSLAQAAPATTPTPTVTQVASSTPDSGGSAFVSLTQFPQIQTLAQPTSFQTFVNTLYKVCIGAGSVLAVIMIMVAGVQFMTSKGSVASNEKAKSRIQNAILGLVLVLAPTIVFGIINPEILHLNFGTEFSGLQLSNVNHDLFNAAAQPQDAPLPNKCADYQQGVIVPVLNSCSTQDKTSVQVDATCCDKGLQNGYRCCAAPKTAPAVAATQYMYQITITKISTGSSFTAPKPTVNRSQAFNTQKECYDSYAAATNFSSSGDSVTTQCDCSKPRTEFAACKQ